MCYYEYFVPYFASHVTFEVVLKDCLTSSTKGDGFACSLRGSAALLFIIQGANNADFSMFDSQMCKIVQ